MITAHLLLDAIAPVAIVLGWAAFLLTLIFWFVNRVPAPAGSLNIGFGRARRSRRRRTLVLEGRINFDEEVTLTLAPTDEVGNPEPLDGPIQVVLDDPSTAVLADPTDLSVVFVPTLDRIGDIGFTLHAPPLGDIQGVLHVEHPKAQNANPNFGAPRRSRNLP